MTDGSAGSRPDGTLVRGHGGTIAIGVAAGGAGGTPSRATENAGGASASPISSGGTAGAAIVPNVGTGGRPGSGGAIVVTPSGSGGAVGTGGTTSVATGGTTSVATGGTASVATGGQVGSGGVASASASGGTGVSSTGSGGGSVASSAGGAGGTAGPIPPNQGGNMGGNGDAQQGGPDSCAKLVTDYDAAVTKAKSCNAKGKDGACAKAVPAKLSGCGATCSTYVDDDGMVNAVLQKWTKAGCIPESCALPVCINPTGGTCTAGSDDNKGTCTDTLLGL